VEKGALNPKRKRTVRKNAGFPRGYNETGKGEEENAANNLGKKERFPEFNPAK